MRYIFWIIICIGLLNCKSENNKTTDDITIFSDNDRSEKTPLSEEEKIIRDFISVLLAQPDTSSITFTVDTIIREYKDFTNLLLNPGIIHSRNYTLIQPGNANPDIYIEYYKMDGEKGAKRTSRECCEEYKKNFLAEREQEKDEDEYTSIFYPGQAIYGFRIDSTVYLISATQEAIEILDTTFDIFIKEYAIPDEDIIFCRINYIDKETAKKIRPVINRWLKYYDIEIEDFELSNKEDLELSQKKTTSASREFSSEDDIYLPQFHDYSPNARYYINLLESTNVIQYKNGKYYYNNSPVLQTVCLFDRTGQKIHPLIQANDLKCIDGAFWAGNNVFVLTGFNINKNSPDRIKDYFIELFDLNENRRSLYLYEEAEELKEGFLTAINMKSRGIIVQ